MRTTREITRTPPHTTINEPACLVTVSLTVAGDAKATLRITNGESFSFAVRGDKDDLIAPAMTLSSPHPRNFPGKVYGTAFQRRCITTRSHKSRTQHPCVLVLVPDTDSRTGSFPFQIAEAIAADEVISVHALHRPFVVLSRTPRHIPNRFSRGLKTCPFVCNTPTHFVETAQFGICPMWRMFSSASSRVRSML